MDRSQHHHQKKESSVAKAPRSAGNYGLLLQTEVMTQGLNRQGPVEPCEISVDVRAALPGALGGYVTPTGRRQVSAALQVGTGQQHPKSSGQGLGTHLAPCMAVSTGACRKRLLNRSSEPATTTRASFRACPCASAVCTTVPQMLAAWTQHHTQDIHLTQNVDMLHD